MTLMLMATHLVVVIGAAGDETSKIDFNRDVRPILSSHCFKCHGFDENARKAELRLDTQEGLTSELSSGAKPVLAGRPDQSELIARVRSKDASFRMPPDGATDPLSQQQIELLIDWIEQGAPWSEHWSFDQPRQTPLPPVQQDAWAINPIDRFILARLEAEGIAPSAAADRHTLLRRVTLDLIGLLPTLDEIAGFVADSSPAAYERVVDRLLASPHYGERMARRWLDLARYADSNGYSNDLVRSIWPYRDWVINALNTDMPFDQFTIEQLAGDLLPEASQPQIVASGFHRNTPHQTEGGSDPEQYRVERVKNRVDTTGAVWLGLTVGCAQCHSHKFDPISQREYYQLYAFFNSADELPESLSSAAENREFTQLDKEKSALQKQLESVVESARSSELKEQLVALTAEHKRLRTSLPTTLVFRERATRRETFLQIRGSFLDPGEKVLPGTPSRLHPFTMSDGHPANRLDLARWLVRRDNPLTARVIVNRDWQHFFGIGLVETENDLGYQGSLPSHPRLLDWLARDFVDEGFGLKRLHRMIVTSETYRQSSRSRRDLLDLDPGNRLLARQSRHRVEAELIRDVALVASGLLSRQIGGPSVFPPLPPNVMGTSSANHKWPTSAGADSYRRGLYTAIYRANDYPMFSTFDGPDRDNACTRRTRSNTPLQALSLSNNPAMTELFRGLAIRLMKEEPENDWRRMVHAFRICLGRPPSERETNRLVEFYQHQHGYFAMHPEAAERLVASDGPAAKPLPKAATAACYAVSRLLMNLDEFVTRE